MIRRILAARKTMRVSRYQLADKADMDRFKLWQLEAGRVAATPNEELALRQALLSLVKERSVAFHALLLGA